MLPKGVLSARLFNLIYG
ncbi:TPA: protein YchT [Escherichia coli]|nr:protein YchT [Escherichia coli]